MEHNSIGDKMLRAVLLDEKLMAFGEYGPEQCQSLSQALYSDNCIVCAVARIIDGGRRNATENEIYKEVSEYLKRTI